ncbi:hypothetical protein [Natronorubrum daqingense]|uniref:hypothetical protein n=1 Tax=Natronorubrum daqingense TaxID=588898 RepID=UPI0012F85F81|nr:hypothetical protein [Natronorubrum daqingense]
MAFLEPAGERPNATRRRNEAAVTDDDRVVTATVTLTATGEQNRTRGRVDL